jgi:hypothetical protein
MDCMMGPMRGNPPRPRMEEEVVYCNSQLALMRGERSGDDVGFRRSSCVKSS